MAELALTKLTRETRPAIIPSDLASAGGDFMQNSGSEFLICYNFGAIGSFTGPDIFATVQRSTDLILPAPKLLRLSGDGSISAFGPFPPSVYNDRYGRVQFTYSSVTYLKVRAVQFINEINQ